MRGVTVLEEGDSFVIMKKDTGNTNTLCGWVKECGVFACEHLPKGYVKCPADGISKKVSRKTADRFFRIHRRK